MKIEYSERFKKSYETAPEKVKYAFGKQLTFLLNDIRHPSLHAKKYDEKSGMWQARVNRAWRFYFSIEGETYRFQDIMTHPK